MFKIEKLPVIILKDDVVLPNIEVNLSVEDPSNKKALELSLQKYLGNILVFSKDEKGNPRKIGVKAQVLSNNEKDGNYICTIKTIQRAKWIDIHKDNDTFEMEFELINTVYDNYTRELALVRRAVNKFMESGIKVNNFQHLINTFNRGIATEVMVDLWVSNIVGIKAEQKYKYLEIAVLNDRLVQLIEDIEELSKVQSLDNELDSEIQKKLEDSQREYYLKEKMKAIQNELGQDGNDIGDIEELRKQILDAKMPEEIEKKALKELNRYQTLGPNNQESNVIRQYLDFIIELPWSIVTEDNEVLEDVQKQLDDRHYGLDKIKQRIVEYLAVKIMTKKNPQTILCLAGPPGVGKTSLAKSIADALGRKFVKQSLGGVRDEAEIRGHRRTYVGALPGRILSGMKDAKTKNPVFLLDEIDKMSSDYKGDPSSAMLEVLDPEQNTHFKDHYLGEEFDLSEVMFIATANYLQNIPEALRDRMEIINLSSYTELEKFHIAKNHLIKRQLDKHGLDEKKFSITDEAILDTIRFYTREAGVRELERKFGQLVRKSITEILINKKDSINITNENLDKFLDKKAYNHHHVREHNQPGTVTGLAYTAFGGDTLDVEVTYFKGKGGLVLTGKLGEVMQESAKAALSFVKANASDLGIDYKLFEQNDIHIHVPEGATPKDGPSAGVTMVSALVSALTSKKADKYTGMTGEITLHGNVLPIGGLKEKSIAAHRTGLKRIFIPFENKRDIMDIPDEVQKELEIIPVKHVNEIVTKIM